MFQSWQYITLIAFNQSIKNEKTKKQKNKKKTHSRHTPPQTDCNQLKVKYRYHKVEVVFIFIKAYWIGGRRDVISTHQELL